MDLEPAAYQWGRHRRNYSRGRKKWDASSGKDGFLCFGIVEIFNMQEGKKKLTSSHLGSAPHVQIQTKYICTHIYTFCDYYACTYFCRYPGSKRSRTNDRLRGAVLSNVVQSSRPDQKNKVERSMFNFLRKLVINPKPSADCKKWVGRQQRRSRRPWETLTS